MRHVASDQQYPFRIQLTHGRHQPAERTNFPYLILEDATSGRLDDIRQLVDAPDSDLFDVLGYVLFANSPRTRTDRAENVRDGGLSGFDRELRELLLGILKSYEKDGEGELATKKLGQFLTARYGSVGESKDRLGELSDVRVAYLDMQRRLYNS